MDLGKYGEGYIRFSITQPTARIEEAAARLRRRAFRKLELKELRCKRIIQPGRLRPGGRGSGGGECGRLQPEPDSREKFFLTIPYPYSMETCMPGTPADTTIGDSVARFQRMQGKNVLFSWPFMLRERQCGPLRADSQERPLIWEVYTRLHGIPEDELTGLNTPEKIVLYFRRQAKAAMQSIGYSIDWRREFTTTDPAYSKFIEWQYGILRRLNYVVKGSHPVRWCPHDRNPGVEDHDILRERMRP